MKETQLHLTDEVKIISQKEVEKQLKHIGRQRLKPGHQCFEINHTTKEVALAKVEKTYHLTGTQQAVVTKENHFYILALNSKNALKKYNKYFR